MVVFAVAWRRRMQIIEIGQLGLLLLTAGFTLSHGISNFLLLPTACGHHTHNVSCSVGSVPLGGCLHAFSPESVISPV